MSRSHLAWRAARLVAGLLLADLVVVGGNAEAQCRGGGEGQSSGGMTTAGVALAGSSGATSSGVAVFTGPGSLAYDLLAAQMYQQRYALALQQQSAQQQAARQQELAARRTRAEQSRGEVAARRQRTYAYLAAKYGAPRSKPAASYLAAYSSGRR